MEDWQAREELLIGKDNIENLKMQLLQYLAVVA